MDVILATALLAAVTFVTPQQGGQAFGVLPIEITTTATNVDRVEFYVDGALAGVARKPPYRIVHDFGSSPLAHEITAKVFSNKYTTTTTANVVTTPLTAGEVMTVDLVEVPLRVRANSPVSASDLRVRENGVEQTIREISPTRAAAHFVFVVDRSLSMSGGRLEAAFRAIDEETARLRRDDAVSVVLFNHIVSRPREYRRSEPLSRTMRDVTPSGGTSLRDAVASARSAHRTYVIAITDGGDRNSLMGEEAALQKLSGTRLVVNAIILGDKSTFLDKAARNTGGTAVRATARTLQSELRKIINDINSRYVLSYQSTSKGSGWRAIAVEPRRRDITVVSARKGYFPQ